MASILTHYLIAERYAQKYKNYSNDDLISFLVGAVAADAPNSQGKGLHEREISHFGSSPSMELMEKGNFNLDDDILNYDLFLEKYNSKLDNPFVEGYLLHLYSDKKWFEEIISNLLDINADKINKNAKNSNDLSFKEAILWYTKNLYETYNIHDIFFYQFLNLQHIELMSNYDVNDCPIDEIDKTDLNDMLKGIKVKSENLRNSTISEDSIILISFDDILSFIDECTIGVHKLYFNKK